MIAFLVPEHQLQSTDAINEAVFIKVVPEVGCHAQ